MKSESQSEPRWMDQVGYKAAISKLELFRTTVFIFMTGKLQASQQLLSINVPVMKTIDFDKLFDISSV